MKIAATLLMLLVLFLPNTYPRDYTQWDLPSGAVGRIGKGWVDDILYSPDGTRLAILGSGGIWFYDTTTDQVGNASPMDRDRKAALLGGRSGLMYSAAFSPDGKMLATGREGGSVVLWDTETGKYKSTLNGYKSWVYSVLFSPDGPTLGGWSEDKRGRTWSGRKGEHRGSRAKPPYTVISLAFSPDGATLAVGSGNGVQLWDPVTQEPKGILTGHIPKMGTMAFSPDGKMLVVKAENNLVLWVWDTETWQLKQTLSESPGSGYTLEVANGRTVASAIGDGVAFSPDGTTIASAAIDGTVWLWDTETWELKQTLTVKSLVSSVVFSPDGLTLAGGSNDGTVLLWDTETWELRHTLTGHLDEVYRVAFSPDGRTLASAIADGTVRLWDTETWEPKRTLTDGYASRMVSIAFSPDGQTLASAGGIRDRIVRLWDVENG